MGFLKFFLLKGRENKIASRFLLYKKREMSEQLQDNQPTMMKNNNL